MWSWIEEELQEHAAADVREGAQWDSGERGGRQEGQRDGMGGSRETGWVGAAMSKPKIATPAGIKQAFPTQYE